jgi:hypothetical protein
MLVLSGGMRRLAKVQPAPEGDPPTRHADLYRDNQDAMSASIRMRCRGWILLEPVPKLLESPESYVIPLMIVRFGRGQVNVDQGKSCAL